MLVSTIKRLTVDRDGGDTTEFGSMVLGSDKDGDEGDLKR